MKMFKMVNQQQNP